MRIIFKFAVFMLILSLVNCGQSGSPQDIITSVSEQTGKIEFINENNETIINIIDIDEPIVQDSTISCPIGIELGPIVYEYQGGVPETLLFDTEKEPITRLATPNPPISVAGVDSQVFGRWAFTPVTNDQGVQFLFTVEILADQLTFTNTCSL